MQDVKPPHQIALMTSVYSKALFQIILELVILSGQVGWEHRTPSSP